MAKIRVYELARELNIESKLLVTRIKDMGIDVASHQSTLSSQEVDTIRRKVSGGEVGGSEGAASPSVVLRRRKRVEGAEGAGGGEAAVEAPAAAGMDTAAEEAKLMVRRRAGAKSGEEQAEPMTRSADALAALEAAFSKPAAEDHEPEEEAAAVAEEAPAPEPVAPPSSSPPAAAARQPEPAEPAEPARPPLRRVRPEFASATVVRRATPEERMELQKREMQQQQANMGGAQSLRHEDSRGTRITGMSFPGKPPEDAGGADDPFGIARRSKKVKSAADEAAQTEAEIAARKKAALKNRKQHLSTRDLLAATDDEDETESPEGVDVPAPVSIAARAKTVYTPSGGGGSRRSLKRRKDLKQTQITTPRAAYRVVKMGAAITIAELAKQLSVKGTEIIKKLMIQGEMVTINSSIDFDTAALMANEYGYEAKDVSTDITDIIKTKSLDEYEATELRQRPPIVTVMGHVDHGKTSILDAIRQTRVAAGEAGGITQHIGAYTVEKNGKTIAFLDTPGHEAFSNMRARGAKLTDIVVLVVAADDGVMPQTIESIAHAREAEVPIIVAINKVDKPGANFDRIYSELATHGVQSEEWGGENQFVKVSAIERIGIEELLESVLLQAEVLELKAVKSSPALGRVVEAHLDKGRGPVSTVMVQNGTLRVGDYLVAGVEFGRVRAMFDHTGKAMSEAGPSTPAEVIGLSGVPAAGDSVNVVEDEKTAKSAADWRRQQAMKVAPKSAGAKLDDLLSRINTEEQLDVSLIIKADTHGSIEAISDAILKLNDNKKNVRNRLIHRAVGGITSSDISLAATSGAIILAFNVRASKILEDDAERSGIPLNYFSIIYDLVDTVKSIMAGKLPPIQSENILGHAQVKQPITVPKIGTVAGSSVTDGKITRNSQLRLIRDDVVIYSGKVKSLRRFKDDVKEVMSGYECGISIEGYNDIKEGDVIEAYVIEETPATLDL